MNAPLPTRARRRASWTSLVPIEFRQRWWLQLAVLGAGLTVWSLLLFVTRRVPTDATHGGVVFNHVASLVLSVFPVLLVGSQRGAGSWDDGVVRWVPVPLSVREIQQVRLLGLVLHLWPVLLTWPLIVTTLGGVYGGVSGWVVATAGLIVALGVLLAMRTRLAAVVIYLALPVQGAALHFLPPARTAAATWMRLVDSPWAPAALLVLACGLAHHVLTARPPRPA